MNKSINFFYVPPTHTEEIKNAVFAAGTGTRGLYSCYAWQTLGEDQFVPLQGGQAFIG